MLESDDPVIAVWHDSATHFSPSEAHDSDISDSALPTGSSFGLPPDSLSRDLLEEEELLAEMGKVKQKSAYTAK